MNATIEEQGMLKILEHVYSLTEHKRKIKSFEIIDKTGLPQNQFAKLLKNGIIECTGKSSQPYYQWVGIRPNIYMAKELFKDYFNTENIIPNEQEKPNNSLSCFQSVLDVKITATENVNSKIYRDVNLIDLLHDYNKYNLHMLYVGGIFKIKYGYRDKLIKSSGLMALRIFQRDNTHLSNWTDLKDQLKNFLNIAYISNEVKYNQHGAKIVDEYLIIVRIPSNIENELYEKYARSFIIDMSYYNIIISDRHLNNSIYDHCFYLNDKTPYFYHNPLIYNKIIDNNIISQTVNNTKKFTPFPEPTRKILIEEAKILDSSGKSQRKIAHELGISNATVSRYLRKDQTINVPFDDFWNLYDKKEDRDKCEKKWKVLKDNERSLIMEKLPPYIAATPDKKFRKNPITYLNNRSWENEIITHTYIKDTNYKPNEKLSLDSFTDQQLWDELKKRGWEGNINKSMK